MSNMCQTVVELLSNARQILVILSSN